MPFKDPVKDREYHKLHARRIRKQTPEKNRATCAKYRAANLERCRALARDSMRAARAADPEGTAARIAQWQKDNKANVVCISARRRARMRNAPGNGFTAAEWKAKLEEYGHKCAYCQRGGLPLQQEHVIPLVRGGAHDTTNIVPACADCNFSKHDKTPEEWNATR